ncbi:MAG TPA: DNA methyltransferase [Spirochaetia bacterium]|nr:DNA methyltransferase [Spirochaetia bacterium]
MQGPDRRAVLYRADCRRMPELADAGIDLVVTSPPYWQIKDYGVPGQIGWGQTLHQYLDDLGRVWRELHRVLAPGARLCVNIGDQFARASLFGRYRVIPLHAEITCQCAEIGFDYLGSIIWRKKTTMNTSGGAVVMGSYPYPPNGIVEIDFEYILLFKKPGTVRRPDPAVRRDAALSRDEWKSWFSGHWELGGARKKGHDAPFPEEIPRRLIRMFSFPGDTVLDPFMGSGTTARVAVALDRQAVGYEINGEFLDEARQAPGTRIVVPDREAMALGPRPASGGRARIPDLAPPSAPTGGRRAPPTLHTVQAVGDDCSIELENGTVVRFLGLEIRDPAAARDYLRRRVLKKQVFLKDERPGEDTGTAARVVLKNRINVNAQLLKLGAATPVDAAGR